MTRHGTGHARHGRENPDLSGPDLSDDGRRVPSAPHRPDPGMRVHRVMTNTGQTSAGKTSAGQRRGRGANHPAALPAKPIHVSGRAVPATAAAALPRRATACERPGSRGSAPGTPARGARVMRHGRAATAGLSRTHRSAVDRGKDPGIPTTTRPNRHDGGPHLATPAVRTTRYPGCATAVWAIRMTSRAVSGAVNIVRR